MEPEKIGRPSSLLRGHAAMLLAAVFWGAMSPIAKHVMLSGTLSPMALSAIRIAGGAIVFWIAELLLPERICGDGKIKRADLPIILLMSVLIISANQGLYIVGIGFTTPFEATVMTTVTPVFTMLLAAIFISMPMTVMKVTGVAMGLGGALLLAFASRDGSSASMASDPTLGNLMCLGAQICAAFYFTMFRNIINRYHPFTLLKWLFLCGALTWVPFARNELASINLTEINLTLIGSIIYIVIFPTFLSYLFMVYAQQRLKPTTVSMYSYVQPVTAAVLASILGLAVFGWTNILATVLIFTGVAMVALTGNGKSH